MSMTFGQFEQTQKILGEALRRCADAGIDLRNGNGQNQAMTAMAETLRRGPRTRAFDGGDSDRVRSFDIQHRAEHTDLTNASLKDVCRWLEGFTRGSREDRRFAAQLAQSIRSYINSSTDSDWMRRSADKSLRYGQAAMRRRRAGDADVNSDSALSARALCGWERATTPDAAWLHENTMQTFGL